MNRTYDVFISPTQKQSEFRIKATRKLLKANYRSALLFVTAMHINTSGDRT